MGATNHTTYYELSQFIGTDKPAWLQDYNGDMTKIDAAIHEAKNAADDANTAASNAQGDATDALNAIETINTTLGTIEDTLGTATGNISTINSLIGNGTPTTSDQTIIGAINGIEGAIAPREDGDDLANSYAIGEQFARGGSVYTALTPLSANTPFASLTLNTDYKVSDSLTEQIAEVAGEFAEIVDGYAYIKTTALSVTADGVKTRKALIEELAADFTTVVNNLGDDELIKVLRYSFKQDETPNRVRFLSKNASITDTASWTGLDAVNVFSSFAIFSSSSATLYYNQNGTITDAGAEVPADGAIISLQYAEYKKIV